jgi:hypothetical protein
MVSGACEGVRGGNQQQQAERVEIDGEMDCHLLDTGETLEAGALLLLPRQFYD